MPSGLDLASARSLIPVDDREMLPPPSLFLHASSLHGQAHVGRVMIHALRLIAATGCAGEAPRLWAAVYLHDIARLHDGRCPDHGARAWSRLPELPEVRARFARGGVRVEDAAAIEYAVGIHCSGEPEPSHPHYRLAALLKDADGLDRVRLSDLKLKLLRHAEARAMVPFAQWLYDETARTLHPGPDLFAQLLDLAIRGTGPEST